MKLRNNWRAGYAETCTSGSEGGSEKPGLATDKGAWFLPYKSTSSTNIALGLVHVLRHIKANNCRVLLIDTDSQSHATLVTTGRNDFDTTNSLYSVLMAERQSAPQVMADVIVPSHWDENLHVLPASPLLEQAERELQGTAGSPYRLADPLSKIAPHYAAIVIDTRPSFSLMTEMALVAATDAIVPVEPRYLETVGLMSVIGKIHEIEIKRLAEYQGHDNKTICLMCMEAEPDK